MTDDIHTLIKRHYDNTRLKFSPPFHCIKDDIIYSNLYNAYTLVQVPGERFFILTAKEALPLIKDDFLVNECKTFIAQEAEHAKIHHAYNEALVHSHYTRAQDIIDRWDQTFDAWTNPNLPLEKRLLFVVMAEIFTAHIAEDFFQRWHGQWDRLNNDIALLFSFHNVEEIEHKSLCFDLFSHLFNKAPNDKEYHSEWITFKKTLIEHSIHTTTYFTACDALLNHQPIPRQKAIEDYLTANDGIFPNNDLYPDFQSTSFHPWNHDSRHWIDIWEREWLPRLQQSNQ